MFIMPFVLFQRFVRALLKSDNLMVLEINSSSKENVELCALVCAEAFEWFSFQMVFFSNDFV